MNISPIRLALKPLLKSNLLSFRLVLNLQMVALTVFVIISMLCIRQMEGFESLELIAFDRMMKTRPNIGQDPRLLIVGISEQDIEKYDFPIPDQILADTLATIAKFEPAAIGLDIYRDKSKQLFCESEEEGYQALVKQMERPNLFAIMKGREGEDNYVAPPPSVPKGRVGFNDLVFDPDTVVRRNVVFMPAGDKVLQSFSLRLAIQYLKQFGLSAKVNPDNHKQILFGKSSFSGLQIHDGGYQKVDSNGYQILLNYRPTDTIAKHISLNTILNNGLKSEDVKGKIVLIGTTAPSGKDLFVTPLSKKNSLQMSGIEIHAHMTSQFISAALDDNMSENRDFGYNSLFWFLPESVEILWIILCGIWGSFLAWRIQHPLWVSIANAGSVIAFLGISIPLFINGLWMPIATPIVTLILTSSATLGAKFIHNVLYDTMTGLPNRGLFTRRLRHFQRKSISQEKIRNVINMEDSPTSPLVVAVLLLDIDRFKIFHAVLGQTLCDNLLIAFAKRIQKVLNSIKREDKNPYILARSGEDEFAILLKNPSEKDEAMQIANEIQRQMSRPFRFDENEVFTSSNIGIAFGSVGDDRELLRDAYAAMNQAKASGKDKPEIFESIMESSAIERFQVERDLRRAVTKNRKNGDGTSDDSLTYHSSLTEFRVYYQPLISLKTGKIIGFEALVRWQHPERGLVPPNDFIPIAEETGVIIQIGEWVMREACRQAVQWMEQFPTYKNLIISVNLSVKQFEEVNIVKCVEKVLKETAINPQNLKLEITESMAMKDLKATLKTLRKLKNLDVKLSIDDFGTGYSSLAYVSQFPLDTLKVDRSFLLRMDVNDEESQIIVKTIIALAHDLKLEVIAEGIEFQKQLLKLKSLRCEYGQGYLFSRPVPKNEAETLLAEDKSLCEF